MILRNLEIAAMVLAMGLVAAESEAQPYVIDWFTIDTGGGNTGAGRYNLWGTAGQHDAAGARSATGGSYELAGGFWTFQQLVCTIHARFDLDRDCDVDAADMIIFAACAAGPELPGSTAPDCVLADSNRDGDIDQEDFAAFQRCYSGEDRMADPNCS